MEYADYHVVYVDSRVSRDLNGKLIHKSEPSRSHEAQNHNDAIWEDRNSECLRSILGEIEEVRNNLKSLLSVFNSVYTCSNGNSCMARITHLESLETNIQPVLVMLGAPVYGRTELSQNQSLKDASISSDFVDIYGLALLQHISDELSNSPLSKLVVPIAMIYSSDSDAAVNKHQSSTRTSRPYSGGFPVLGSKTSSPARAVEKISLLHTPHTVKCVDAGAIDVLTSPLHEDRIRGLTLHAYRAHREALNQRAKFLAQKKLRKRSWLGNNDNKPYAYLREAMVSGLMTGICNPDEIPQTVDLKQIPSLEKHREERLIEAVGSWAFSGHDYSDDELVHAARLMLQHALKMPELEKWRLSSVDLKVFLASSRAAYNGFVSYHNFRHVVDVMQAIFYFLVQLGTLPPYPPSKVLSFAGRQISPTAALLRPFDALTLLITAIGHDVGHPGVNNAFLVALNAPLAQLYNDKSVLEAFHCAAYSQILRRYWKAAFEDMDMRGLMINSILATDMGVHFKYMKELGNLQSKVHHNNGTDGWSPQILEEYRVLACALLVKCADISNVARPFDIAAKWADILQHEFANQGRMEQEVGIPTTLFGGPPELGNVIKLGNSQNSFMNIFARPLFEGMTDIMPAMGFAVEEMKVNQGVWTQKVKLQTAKEEITGGGKNRLPDGPLSPRSGSPDKTSSQPELSHPEGLPASQPLESSPISQAAQAAQAVEDSRRASASSVPSHLVFFDSSPQHLDSSRRSSIGYPSNHVDSTPDSASYSRRSSGASPAANAAHTTVTARRRDNSSPSQLQLAPTPESRAQIAPSEATLENRQPYGRASEDTLSQTCFTGITLSDDGSRRDSRVSGGGGGGGDVARRGSKGNDTDHPRSNQFPPNPTPGRPYANAHHRSSSGAHTNNTNMSQSTPYSPTGTQATSVLTVDSDQTSSRGRVDCWTSPDRQDMPKAVNVEGSTGDHRFGVLKSFDGPKDVDVKTSVVGNGSIRGNGSTRVIRPKGSRFNFNFWKKRRSTEASP